MKNPLDGRPGLQVDRSPDHPLTKALRKLGKANSLSGAVLLTIDRERVGINSFGCTPEFGAAMERIGDMILARFDDGEFDGALTPPESFVDKGDH